MQEAGRAAALLQHALARGWISPQTLAQAQQSLQRGLPPRQLLERVSASLLPAQRAELERLWAQRGVATLPDSSPAGPAPSGSAPVSKPGVLPGPGGRVGKYELLAELGRGGMGVVYRARHPELGREVAIKLLSAEDLSPSKRERFRLEAEVSARLRHPGIVPIHDVGHDAEGRPYLVMDLVEGEPLSARLQHSGPLAPRKAAELVRQVADALHHAHQRAILHRDLKPDNVILTPEGRPVVVDFGLAKVLEGDREGHTRSGVIVGTPGYLPPEQAAGSGVVDWRADVYGLGATLYALLTGHPPFEGESLIELLAAIAGREPTPPSRERAGIDRDLDTICLTCLEKEPGARYASAQALSADLTRFLANQPILAKPPTLGQRASKWVARNRKLSAVLGVAAVLGTVAGVGLIAYERERRVEQARQREQTRRDALAEARQQALSEATEAAEAAWGAFEASSEGQRLALALRCVQAGHRVRALDPSDAGAEPLLRAALNLGEVARGSKQWALAAEAYRQAAELPGGAEAAELGLGAVEREREAKRREREQAVQSILARVESGEARTRPEGLEDAVFELLNYAGDDTQALLAARLLDVCRTLLQVEVDLLVPLAPAQLQLQLREALAARERNVLEGEPMPSPQQLLLIQRAVFAAVGQASPGALGQIPQAYMQKLESARTRALGPGGEDLAQVLCRCLGRMRGETGRQALFRYLHLETSDRRAVFAGLALLRFDDSPSVGAVNNAKLRLGRGFDERINAFLGTHKVETTEVARTPASLIALANHKFTTEDYTGAVEDTTAALAARPDDLQALSTRGMAYLRLGRKAEALADLQRTVELDPDNAVLWSNLGQVLETLPGGHPRAIEAYDRSLTIRRDTKTLVNRGVIYARMGQAQRALADYDAALELDPENGRAYEHRGLLHGQANRLDLAIRDFDRAVQVDPRSERGWANRGMAYSLRGELTVALESYDKAISFGPKTGHHYAQRARIRLLLEDYAGTVSDADQALRLDPRRGEAYVFRADAQRKLGNLADARRDLEQALRMLPPGHPNRGEAEALLRHLDAE